MTYFSKDPMILRQIILDRCTNPVNKGLKGYEHFEHYVSNTCIDDVTVEMDFDNKVIKDIRFDGEACSISVSSADIICEQLVGKTFDEALKHIENYSNMLYEKPYNDEMLGELIAFMNVHKQPSRIKCAINASTSIQTIIKKTQR